MDNIKEFRKNYYDIERNIREKRRICSYSQCSNHAIRSHNISEALLSLIVEEGRVRKFNVHPYKGLEFESIGIRMATTFSGFCSQHDTSLFSSIDSVSVDLSNIENLLLFNYRATIQEKINKVNKSDIYENSGKLFERYGYPLVPYYYQRVKEYKFNYEVDNWYAGELLSSIASTESNFLFRCFEIPYQDVIASELFTLEPNDITALKRRVFERYRFLLPFSNLYVHIIPNKKKRFSNLILSMHKKDEEVLSFLYSKLISLSMDKVLSDFLLLYLESWVCSESFYRKFIYSKKQLIEVLFTKTASQEAIARETDINLFI